jgi:lysophospholipase L1-like esterase
MLYLVIFTVLIIGLAIGYQTLAKNLMKPPPNYPKVSAILPNKKILVCAGDSITHGNVSYDWVKDLSGQLPDYQVFNAGINSDLSYTVLNRLEEIIAVKPQHINILIGTNDIMAQARPLKKSDRYIKNGKIAWGEQPTIKSYEHNLKEIIRRLKLETTAQISLMSIPVIGEDLSHPIMKTVENYNEVVKNVAYTEGLTYLTLFENQKQFLQDNKAQSHIPFEKTASAIISAAQLHILFAWSFDKITQKRHHLLTFDNLHFNSKGGGIIKDLLLGHLNKSL